MIYLDYASTSPIREEVLDTYIKLLKNYAGNADSLHELGRESSKVMEESRARIAQLFNLYEEEVIFTSGASEANNMAIKGYCFANPQRGKHIITSRIEHSSVSKAVEQLQDVFGYEVSYLTIDKEGKVSLEELKSLLRKDTVLVSIAYVNNELGVIQPIEEISDIVHHNSQAKLHVDMVQALGKIPCDLSFVDMASFSAHKINGLKGSGLLIKKKNITLTPLISGGQQEFGERAGTSNVAVNTVLAKNIRLALDEQQTTYTHVKELNDYMREELLKIEGIVINTPIDGSPFILNFSYANLGSEIMQNALDEKGIYVSSISTCSTKKTAKSKVLIEMGLESWRTTNMLRMSFSKLTTKEECREAIEALKEVLDAYVPKR